MDGTFDGRALVAVAVGGVALDLAVRAGGVGVGTVVLIVLISLGLLAAGQLRNPQARALAAVAPLFGMWFAFRASPWLLIPNIISAVVLQLAAASYARGGSVLDLGPSRLMSRSYVIGGHLATGPALVGSAIRPRLGGGKLRSAARLALVVVPILLVLGLLLASADAIFASLFQLRLDGGSFMTHLFLLALGAWGMAGLLRLTRAREPEPDVRYPDPPLRPVESLVTLGGMVLLYALFVATQLFALSEGGRRILETRGLTYAEYARSGFFQLLTAAAVTAAVIVGLRSATNLTAPRHHRWFVALAQVAIAMTVAVVFVAVRRMNLYEGVFGLTMLRLYVKVACFGLAASLVLLGAWLLVPGGRGWFLAGVVAIALVTLLALNVVNPEAIVVRHNIDHYQRTARLDPYYLAALSDDALPTAAEEIQRLIGFTRTRAERVLCSSSPASEGSGWAGYNLSRAHADHARLRLCGE